MYIKLTSPRICFQLGLFAGGLSSFVSSNENQEDKEMDEEEEAATAGMELTVLGTQLRPFVFFTGQGELMGHVWSGTASEKTPAYQVGINRKPKLKSPGIIIIIKPFSSRP